MYAVPDTETQQTQSSVFIDVESQPIENIVWGRLYPKRVTIKSLGTRQTRSKLILEASSRVIGIDLFNFKNKF